jgi:hypothetical protein
MIRHHQVEAAMQVRGQCRPRTHRLGGEGLEPLDCLVPIDIIGFHNGELQALGRHAGAFEQRGAKSAISTPKIQRPERAVAHQHAMDMGQVSPDIFLCFCRMLLEKGICVTDGPE